MSATRCAASPGSLALNRAKMRRARTRAATSSGSLARYRSPRTIFSRSVAMRSVRDGALSATLEELHRLLVLLRRRSRLERPEVPSLAGLGILLLRVEPVLTGFQLPDHA